jgi:NAD(P)-dependent dehydrogenase (short-subunit alcohol dehydrogenase family)
MIYFGIIVVVILSSIALHALRGFISPVLELPRSGDLRGQSAVVTGGCGGIGRSTAEILYNLNASVILGCRNVTLGRFICNGLKYSYSSNHLNAQYPLCIAKELDLSSFGSVRSFAADVGFIPGNIPNIIIANAGIRMNEYRVTFDGLESHFQVNFLGHFLLVNLLLPFMLRSHYQIRIVHVSSSAHHYGSIEHDIYGELSRSSMNSSRFHDAQRARLEGVYGDTKLMQVLFSHELQRRFDLNYNKKEGTKKLLSISLHPGFISSNMGHSDTRWLQWVIVLFRPLLARDTRQGAITSLCACVLDGLSGGEYLDNCKASRPSAKSLVESDPIRLWESASKLVGLTIFMED